VSVVLVDSEALTRRWLVAFTYARPPPGSTVYDYACAENNRNPVTSNGRTLTLDRSREAIDKLESRADRTGPPLTISSRTDGPVPLRCAL
jgi:hypothetical protein